MTAIEERTLDLLARICNVPRERLQPEVQLVEGLDLDSALTLDLLMTLEDELGQEISEVEAAELVTVGDVLAFVRRFEQASPRSA